MTMDMYNERYRLEEELEEITAEEEVYWHQRGGLEMDS